MIKFFLLTVFCVISTQVNTFCDIMTTLGVQSLLECETTCTDSHIRIWFPAAFTYSLIDRLVSAGYILLTFSFTQTYYDKTCGCADACCLKLWTRRIKEHTVPKPSSSSMGSMQSTTQMALPPIDNPNMADEQKSDVSLNKPSKSVEIVYEVESNVDVREGGMTQTKFQHSTTNSEHVNALMVELADMNEPENESGQHGAQTSTQ